MIPVTELVVPHRFRGPQRSGNGGWTAGSLAALVPGAPADHSLGWPPVRVRLQQPPPLDVPLSVTADGEVVTASYDGAAVATAQVVEAELGVVDDVTHAQAQAASARFPGLAAHPFPSCFTCGTGREDGLRIFPGEVEPGAMPTRVAAPWTPDASLAADFHVYGGDDPLASLAVTWAALDCPGGWAGDVGERPMVLGQMTARIDALARIGEPHVVVGELRGAEGRKVFTAATLLDAEGRVVGTAEHVWITVDPTDFN